MAKPPKLNARQKIFVAEVVKPGATATKAALKAGYSKKTARTQGSALLTKPDIKVGIQSAAWSILGAAHVDAVKLVLELKKMAFSAERDELKFKAILTLLKMAGYLDNSNRPTEDAPQDIKQEIKFIVEVITRTVALPAGNPKVIESSD